MLIPRRRIDLSLITTHEIGIDDRISIQKPNEFKDKTRSEPIKRAALKQSFFLILDKKVPFNTGIFISLGIPKAIKRTANNAIKGVNISPTTKVERLKRDAILCFFHISSMTNEQLYSIRQL